MNGDSMELNLYFAHCYKCYRQPIERNSFFIILTCCHIYCDTCQNLCAGNQAPDLMFCFVCRKPAKYMPLEQKINDLAAFQNKLPKSNECPKKVVDAKKPIANQCDIKSNQIECKTVNMEPQSSVCMSRKRYIELIRMAGSKSNRLNDKDDKKVDQTEQTELSTRSSLGTTSSFQSASKLYRQMSQQ